MYRNNMHFKTIFITVLLAVLSQPVFAHSKLEPRINELEAQIQRLQLLIDSQGLQEMYMRQQSLQQENRDLRGNIEQLNYQIQQLRKQQREFLLDIDKRMQDLENNQTMMNAVPADEGTMAAMAEGEEPQYRKAFNLLKDGNYPESIAAFEAFISAFPESSLASNAQYWMAEANYAAGRYEQAARAFDKVRTEYPSSPKVPDASLKLGFSYAALGRSDSAKSVLNELIQKFPGSSVAKLAEDRLKQLN